MSFREYSVTFYLFALGAHEGSDYNRDSSPDHFLRSAMKNVSCFCVA